jgi:hypothetical protein
MASEGSDSTQAEIATLKAEVSSLRGITEKLDGAVTKLSEDLKNLSVNLEGATTRLNIAIGVAVFIATMTIPLLVKSFSSSPSSTSALPEILYLQRQIERERLEEINDLLERMRRANKPPDPTKQN